METGINFGRVLRHGQLVKLTPELFSCSDPFKSIYLSDMDKVTFVGNESDVNGETGL